MLLVLDGYNILKKLVANKIISHGQREAFMKQLQWYASHKGHTVLIVFDGGPSFWPTQEQEKLVSVVYSGLKMSADDYIKQYLETHRGKNPVLVSTDRALQHFAQQQSLSAIDAEQFIHFFKQEFHEEKSIKRVKSAVQKISSEFSPELDKLMIEGSARVQPKQEDNEEISRQKQQALSKKEKKKHRILKKL